MKLKHLTKENTTPKGKNYIFIHACREDKEFQSKIITKLLSFEQGYRYCIWYSDEPEIVFSAEGIEALESMSIFIPLITKNYFNTFVNNHPDHKLIDAYEDLQLKGVAVLPLLDSAELIIRFNKTFGEKHAIALSLPDADHMVEEQLRRFLSDDELEQRITKEAFAGKLFLSYRKMDRIEAKKIMKAIHDTDAAGAAAIWFDEFLVAGRDFNDEIKDNLLNCDAMALAVTPNLLEEGNYVRDVEYDEAIKHGVNVLPLEAVCTNDDELVTAFPGIKPRIDINDRDALEKLLKKAGFNGKGSSSSFAEYLLGMAFFIPVNVEKDIKRAVKLFEQSADHNCVEACEQLGKLYLKGIGVKRDRVKAISYYKKAYRLLMNEDVTKENLRQINRLFYDFNGLPMLLKCEGRVSEANEIQQAFLERIESTLFKNEDEFILYRINALTDLANMSYEYELDTASIANRLENNAPSEERLRHAKAFADRAQALLERYHGEDREMAEFLQVVVNDQYADICKYQDDLNGAIHWKEESKRIIEPLVLNTGNIEYMERSFQISNNLGLFYREAAIRSIGNRDKNYKNAEYNLSEAVRKARQLESLKPEYRVDVVEALSNRTLVANNSNQQKAFILECYEVLLKQMKDDGVSKEKAWTLENCNSIVVHNIKVYSKPNDRRVVFKKIYEEEPPKPRWTFSLKQNRRSGCILWLLILLITVCVILQITGLMDIAELINSKLGPYGQWIIAGIIAVLCLMSFVRRE